MNAIFRHGLREANQLVRLTLPGQKFIPHLGIRGIVTELNDSSTPVIGNPSDNKLKKIQFPPFVKDLFLGNFNKSILNYAEVLNYDRYFVLLRQLSQLTQFLEDNREILEQVDERGVVPEEILIKLKALDMYGLMIPAEYGGADLMNTEVLRLFQELGINLSLAELFVQNELMCTRAIVLQGTQEQKEKYLKPIATGDLWTAYCITEPKAGSDVHQIESEAVFDQDTQTYSLKGTKTWVSNAIRANLFLVLANLQTNNYLGEKEGQLTAFLVEKDTPGVEVSVPYNLTAFNGLQVCDIQFNCTLPASALLGSEGEGLDLLGKLIHNVKYFSAAGLVTRMRDLLDKTIKHTLARKQFGTKLNEFELIQEQLGKCASKIYALEAMLYITSGLADVGIEPDVEAESTIVYQFAVESFDFVSKECLAILGARANLEEEKLVDYVKESLALQSLHGTPNLNKCYVALSAVKHVIENKDKYLGEVRAPGVHPIKFSKFMFNQWRSARELFTKSNKLENHVHPRLLEFAPLVDKASKRLPLFAESLLMEDGLNSQVRQVHLERLADMSMDVYAMTCVLSRASRSYVVGHAHANHEIMFAISFLWDARNRVEMRYREMARWMETDGNRDTAYKEVGEYLTKQGAYVSVNPLIKNSV